MKRDVDLVRDILLWIEAGHSDIKSDVTANRDIINHQVQMMIEDGLLSGQEINEGQWQIDLTWKGHELLELIRDRWDTIKQMLNDVNCYNFEFIQQIARRLIDNVAL